MNVGKYLPSAQFVSIAAALLFAGGLVYAAQYVSSPKNTPVSLSTASGLAQDDPNWQAELSAIQTQSTSNHLPTPPNPEEVTSILEAAKTSNLTDSVGRSLLINLTAAKGQGLGADIPTQQKILDEALSQTNVSRTKLYGLKDFSVTEAIPVTLKDYGNAVMAVIGSHPKASYVKIMYGIDLLLNADSASKASETELAQESQEYLSIAQELSKVEVPKTVTPFHLVIVNNFEEMGEKINAIGSVLVDPLQGTQALQRLETLFSENLRVFENIAQLLQKNNISFTSDEPGNAWNSFLNTTS